MLRLQPSIKARMHTSALTLIVLTAVLWGNTEAFSDAAVDCCLTTKDTRIPLQILAAYTHQTTDSGCPIPATVFVTKKGKKLCAPPEEGHGWIGKIISHLDKKKKAHQ
ncbi:C-C motif chemokine 19a.2 [Misgurnus anguillicaudatus]|uniref:C-C motif chemokine 19a.2 n=1 Tax=Misgurnus anguillicaudatus TaxID=75329 RepID=UPI002434EFD6|nr:monocyte chemotactic protein 1B-like [Misgurnus anguillicaudatus]